MAANESAPSSRGNSDVMAAEIPDGSYKLKLGKSFNNRPKEFYHTVRYDFKPASLEECKESYVEFGPKGETTISMPKIDASGDVKDVTLFKGSRKPQQKECLLIYDHDTGELTLEELTYGIQVKQVRSGEEEKEKTLNYVKDIRNALKLSDRLAPVNIADAQNTPTCVTSAATPTDDLLMSDDSESSSDEKETESSNQEEDSDSGSEDDIAKSLEAVVATEAQKKLADNFVPKMSPDSDKTKPSARPSHSNTLHNDLHLSDSSDED